MNSLARFIGTRYTHAKRCNHFISFISATSVLGIALGITVLLTVLSVMNGFQKEIRERMLTLTPHVIAMRINPLTIENWPQAVAALPPAVQQYPMTPLVEGQVMLMANQQMQAGLIRGVAPESIDAVLPLSAHTATQSLQTLEPGAFNVILGAGFAKTLGVQIGDSVTIILPQAHVGLVGVLPRVKRAHVADIFKVDYVYDNNLAFMHVQDAATLVHNGGLIDGLQVRIPDPFLAPTTAFRLNAQMGDDWHLSDWTIQNQTYFKAVKTEKTMMTLILVLLIAIAAFNLVSMLVMTVTDKAGDIAILRAMGATKGLVMRVFIWQGMLLGLTGIALGLVGGYWLSAHVTEVVQWIEQLVHRQFLASEVYYIDFLPSDFYWSDAISVVLIAFVMTLCATLYPAWRAAQIWPAEALRYE